MMKPILVIMAAGMGSRYGGLKQLDPIGPSGEIIIDYSIYDAIRAGFESVVFIIKKDIEKEFKDRIGNKISEIINTNYVYQEVEAVPSGSSCPKDRKKPWGTGQAILCCKEIVKAPFAVINADDFYGYNSFEVLYKHLKSSEDYNYSMVGFSIENTLTENGYVSRGICSLNQDGYLTDISERVHIEKFGNEARYTEDGTTWNKIQEESIVSMNMWGFTPTIFDELEAGFLSFLNNGDLLKEEYFLPEAVSHMLSKDKCTVKVLKSSEKWFGVTYKEDKARVKKAIYNKVKEGIYPEKLW